VRDFLAFEADEVDTVNALVDFFTIENPAPELLYANAQKLFVVFLDLASARLVTWKIFIVRFFVAGLIEIVVGTPLRGSSCGFLFCSWHVFQSVFLVELCRVQRGSDGQIFKGLGQFKPAIFFNEQTGSCQ